MQNIGIKDNDIIDFRKKIGVELCKIREERGLTIEGLAEKIGKKKSTVASIEDGRWDFSIDMLALFAMHLGFDIIVEKH